MLQRTHTYQIKTVQGAGENMGTREEKHYWHNIIYTALFYTALFTHSKIVARVNNRLFPSLASELQGFFFFFFPRANCTRVMFF